MKRFMSSAASSSSGKARPPAPVSSSVGSAEQPATSLRSAEQPTNMELTFPPDAQWLEGAVSAARTADGLLLLFERPDAHLEAMVLARIAQAARHRHTRCLVLSAACDRRRILALCLATEGNKPVTVLEPGHAAGLGQEQWTAQWELASTIVTGNAAFGIALAANPSLLDGVDLVLLDSIHTMGSPRDPDALHLLGQVRRRLASSPRCRVFGVTSRRHPATWRDRPLPRLLQFLPVGGPERVHLLDNPVRDNTWLVDEAARGCEVRWVDEDGLWLGGDVRPRPEGWPFKDTLQALTRGANETVGREAEASR